MALWRTTPKTTGCQNRPFSLPAPGNARQPGRRLCHHEDAIKRQMSEVLSSHNCQLCRMDRSTRDDQSSREPFLVDACVGSKTGHPESARRFFSIYSKIVAPIGFIEESGAILSRHYEHGICCKPIWDYLPLNQKQILQGFSEKMSCPKTVQKSVAIVKYDQADRLLFLLEDTWFKEATEPRDGTYSLLSLLHGSANPIDLLPDYQSPTSTPPWLRSL